MEQASKYIVIQLKNEEYGVNVGHVRSIERLQKITSVPQAADFIKGIMNLRGEIIPIVDLKERLNMEDTEHTEHTRVLIVAVENVHVGLVVDMASEVIDIGPDVIEPASGLISHEYLMGVAKLEDRLLMLLNLKRILDFEEIGELKEVITA